MIGTNRKTHISFPEMAQSSYHDITTGIAEGSLLLDEILLSQGLNFGEINSNKFEVQLYNISDVSGQSIVVWQTDEDTTEPSIPIFVGVVESSKQNQNGHYREIVAYDAFYTTANENVSAWWKRFWENHANGATIHDLRVSLIDWVALEEATPPSQGYANDSVLIHPLSEEATLTFGALLKMICELQGTIPNMDRSGKVEYVSLPRGYHQVDNNLNQHDSMFEEFRTAPITAVWIYDMDDNYLTSGGSGAYNPYKVQGNLLIKGIEDLDSMAERLFYAISTMAYTPGDLRYIISDPEMKLGSLLTFGDKVSYIFENVLSGPLMIEQETIARGSAMLEEKSSWNSGIASVRDKAGNDQTQYYIITNMSQLHIADGHNERIIDARFTSNSKTIAIFHAEILLNCDTTSGTETIEGDTYDVYNDNDITITYVYNDVTLGHYKPKEIFTDGNHMLHLLYYIPIQEARLEHFEVYLESIGGDITIDEYGVNAAIYGQNLIGKDNFDGLVEVDDSFTAFNFNNLIGSFTDSAEITLYTPDRAIAEEFINNFNFTDLIGSFTDSASGDRNMIEMYYGDGLTNDENCGVSGTTWTGPGYLISTDVYNTDHITVNATDGVEYQISYDEHGETWLGFLNGEWVEDITMTKSQLEAITQADWTHYPMKLKAILSSEAKVSSIIFVGGNIIAQNGGQNG